MTELKPKSKLKQDFELIDSIVEDSDVRGAARLNVYAQRCLEEEKAAGDEFSEDAQKYARIIDLSAMYLAKCSTRCFSRDGKSRVFFPAFVVENSHLQLELRGEYLAGDISAEIRESRFEVSREILEKKTQYNGGDFIVGTFWVHQDGQITTLDGQEMIPAPLFV